MLNDRFRHPADLEPILFLLEKFRRVDNEHVELWLLNRTRPVTVPYNKVVIDSPENHEGGAVGTVTMPRWLAKNRELLGNNEPLPVQENFP